MISPETRRYTRRAFLGVAAAVAGTAIAKSLEPGSAQAGFAGGAQAPNALDLANCEIHRGSKPDGWVKGILRLVAHRRDYTDLSQGETVTHRVSAMSQPAETGVINVAQIEPGQTEAKGVWLDSQNKPLGTDIPVEAPADGFTEYTCVDESTVSVESAKFRTQIKKEDGSFEDTTPNSISVGDKIRVVDHKTLRATPTPTFAPTVTVTPTATSAPAPAQAPVQGPNRK